MNPVDQRARHTARVWHSRAAESTVIGHLLAVSLSRALPYAAVGLRRARGAISASADARTCKTPAYGRCGGTLSCVGLRRAG